MNNYRDIEIETDSAMIITVNIVNQNYFIEVGVDDERQET